MGFVFRVFDDVVGEELALKLLASADSEAVARFKAELRLARKVTHKNVGRTFDMGREAGCFFITMELVRGDCLRGIMNRIGPMAPTDAAWIARQIAAGLAAAHEVGIVHRDLKPGNVLVSTDARVLVIDWGIASTRDPLAGGSVTGTLDYMAPEQLRGESPCPSHDVYALGLVMFELVAHARAFPGPDAVTRGKARLTGDPDLSALPADHELTRLISQCLLRDGDRRPSAAEIERRLGAFAANGSAPKVECTTADAEAPTVAAVPEAPNQAEPTPLSEAAARAYHQAASILRSPKALPLDAIALFDECLADAPDFLPAIAGRAVAAARSYAVGDDRQTVFAEPSRLAVERALTEAPMLADTHVAHSLHLFAESRFREGLQALSHALTIAPRHAKAHETLGRLECEAGHADRGGRRLLFALGVEPTLRQSISLVARAHALRARPEEFDRAMATVENLGRPTFEELVLQGRVALWSHDRARAERTLAALPEDGGLRRKPLLAAALTCRLVLGEEMLWDYREFSRNVLGGSLSDRLRCTVNQTRAEVEGVYGDPIQALDHIEAADRLGSIDLEWLALCPALDVIREEPRYEAALARTRARTTSLWADFDVPPIPSGS